MTCLKIRLVSLCGHEARVVSTAFSLGYLQEVTWVMGGKSESSKCRIHIAEYRDLSNRHHFQDLVEELLATPRGNVNEQQKLLELKDV